MHPASRRRFSQTRTGGISNRRLRRFSQRRIAGSNVTGLPRTLAGKLPVAPMRTSFDESALYNELMLRRGIIIAQAALAGGLAVVTVFSYVTVPSLILPFTDSQTLVLLAYDGRGRGFLFQGDVPFVVLRDQWGSLRLQSDEEWLQLPDDLVGPRPPQSFRASIRIGNRREVGPFGASWRAHLFARNDRPPRLERGFSPNIRSTYLRIPLWSLVILLMYLPIRQAIIERRTARRRLRNECLACGYSLVGLIERRCPECGTALPACAKCGYDLTGNVSGSCPECGTKHNSDTRFAEDRKNTR